MPENSPVNGLSRPFRASPLSRTVLLRTGVLGAFAAAKRRPRKRRFFFVGNESRLMQQKARGKGQISVGNAKRQKKEGSETSFSKLAFSMGCRTFARLLQQIFQPRSPFGAQRLSPRFLRLSERAPFFRSLCPCRFSVSSCLRLFHGARFSLPDRSQSFSADLRSEYGIKNPHPKNGWGSCFSRRLILPRRIRAFPSRVRNLPPAFPWNFPGRSRRTR